MIQRFLLIILPVLLPFALYYLYWLMTRRRRMQQGEEMAEEDRPWMEKGPWAALLLTGVLLAGAALFFVRVSDRESSPSESLVLPSYKPSAPSEEYRLKP